MPWWSWLLIWTVLVLALFGMLAWFGVRLFRKLMTTMRALEEIGTQLGSLDPSAGEPARERFTPAMFRSLPELFEEVEQQHAARARRRQLRRDRLIARSKLVTYAPFMQRTDPHA